MCITNRVEIHGGGDKQITLLLISPPPTKNDMNKLADLIPIELQERMAAHPECEYDRDFLGFEDVYKAVTQFVPKDKIIIDFGCYLAAQAWLFKDYKNYIGVDSDELLAYRLWTDNVIHFGCTIQHFITAIMPELNGLDVEQCFAICSYVPDEEAQAMVRATFPYCLVYYPT